MTTKSAKQLLVETQTTVVVVLLGREPIFFCASFASDCWPGFSKRRFGSAIVLRVHPLGCGKNALSGFEWASPGCGCVWHSVVKLLGGRVQLVVGRGLQGFRRGWKRLNTDTVEDLVEVFKVAFVDGNG